MQKKPDSWSLRTLAHILDHPSTVRTETTVQCSIFLSETFKWPAGDFAHVGTARRLGICLLRFDEQRSDWRQRNRHGRHMSQVNRILQVCSKWLPVPPQYKGLLAYTDLSSRSELWKVRVLQSTEGLLLRYQGLCPPVVQTSQFL